MRKYETSIMILGDFLPFQNSSKLTTWNKSNYIPDNPWCYYSVATKLELSKIPTIVFFHAIFQKSETSALVGVGL